MAAVRELAFALERFEWTGERLEVVGRWSGLRGRRLSRPVLTVSAAGERHRLTALPGGQLGVRGDEPWRATFAWDRSEDVDSAELEVGRSLLVALPAPQFRPPPPPPTDADLRAELEALRAELAEMRGASADADGLREELQLLRVAHGSLREAHERLEDELETLRDAAAERERLAAERDRLAADLTAAQERLAERDDGEDRERLVAELQSLREAAAARERLAAELAAAQERERDLREEVEATRAEADELRHGRRGPTTNGASAAEDTVPAAATVAGRSGAPRTAAARRSPAAERRAQAARAASAGRVPTVPASTAAIWAVRAVAAILVSGLIAAFVVVLTQVHL
jgi:hypothetical protein